MKWTVGLLILAAAAPAFPAEAPSLIDLLPANSQIVFGVHVRQLLDSKLAQSLSAEMKSSGAELKALIPASGFNFETDLDEILLASTGEGKNPPVLVAARGTFAVDQLAAGATPYHGVPLLEVQSKTQPAGFAFLDSSTVLAGDLAAVKAAIDRGPMVNGFTPTFAARIAKYREQYAIWGIAKAPAGLAKRLSSETGSGNQQMWDSIDRFQIGIGLAKGLDIAAELHARTGAEGAKLASSLQFLQAMMKASQPSLNGKGTNITIDSTADGSVKIALAISEAELEKALKSRLQAGSSSRAEVRSATPIIQSSENDVPTPPVSTPVAGGSMPPSTNNTAVFTLPGR